MESDVVLSIGPAGLYAPVGVAGFDRDLPTRKMSRKVLGDFFCMSLAGERNLLEKVWSARAGGSSCFLDVVDFEGKRWCLGLCWHRLGEVGDAVEVEGGYRDEETPDWRECGGGGL